MYLSRAFFDPLLQVKKGKMLRVWQDSQQARSIVQDLFGTERQLVEGLSEKSSQNLDY